ncbi:hypothetical protein [Pseudobacillus wudalianchiensis]|uniref:hypothetical protein n=1 Tax=Pseudobacillus wudalianchiensis TaxID=1743143 RepID=UPI00159F2045|nr:hypothetical protein [Bacillus wudalianchiensis]
MSKIKYRLYKPFVSLAQKSGTPTGVPFFIEEFVKIAAMISLTLTIDIRKRKV